MSSNTNSQEEKVIELITESFVKPRHIVEASKQPLHLGHADIVLLNYHSIQMGFLFTNNHNNNNEYPSFSDFIDKLKQSLSIALVHFYPLAGRLETRKFEEENTCAVYVDCNKGPGARIIHATAPSITTSDVLSPVVPNFVESFFDLGEKFVNYDCHDINRPLLSIQVTELLDGVFFGFTMSHSVADGTSFMHFVSMLSEIYRSNNDESCMLRISRVPVFDYKPWLESYEQGIKLLYTDLEKFITRQYPESLRNRVFHFSSTSMARLKARANQENENEIEISSFQALTALMWISITKARKLPLEQDTNCMVGVNARTHLVPPITDNYFGNIVGGARVICKVDELLSHDLGWLAKLISDEIKAEKVKCVDLCNVWKQIAAHFSNVGLPTLGDDRHGPNAVIVGGSAKFDMYEPEFGLGRAVGIRMGGYALKEDGKITASPGREGGDSVDLEVSLTDENMAALETDQEFMSFVSVGDF